MREMKAKSEFGKGLVLCLCKFMEHRWKLYQYLDDYKKAREKERPDLFTESGAIELWANGASDHLYEIEAPKNWLEINQMVKKLQDKGLEMGHGFTGKKWTIKDAEELFDLALQIAVKVDKKIGLEPDIGQW